MTCQRQLELAHLVHQTTHHIHVEFRVVASGSVDHFDELSGLPRVIACIPQVAQFLVYPKGWLASKSSVWHKWRQDVEWCLDVE